MEVNFNDVKFVKLKIAMKPFIFIRYNVKFTNISSIFVTIFTGIS